MSEQFKLKTIDQERKELFKHTTLLINAGGRGTRLEPIMGSDPKSGITKALIEMNGETLLDYHLKHAAKLGYKNVVVSAGDHENIKDHVAGKEYGLAINTLLVGEQKGTGGDLIEAVKSEPDLGENIIVQNVDSFVLLDEGALLEQHEQSGMLATIVLTRRRGVPNENAWFINGDNVVVKTLEDGSNQGEAQTDDLHRASSTGIVVFNTQWLRQYEIESDEPISIYSAMLPQLIKERKLGAYENDESLFYDIGTPQNFQKTVANPAFAKALEKYYL